MRFVARGSEKRNRLLVAVARQDPDVSERFRIVNPVDEMPAIAGPRHRRLRQLRFDQQLAIRSGAVRTRLVQTPLAVPARGKHDARSVGRPQGRGIVLRRIERDSGRRPRRRFEHPDIPSRPVVTVHGDALAVG